MQNRYVGDVGDFAKYALLRRLAARTTEPHIGLGVLWCLFPDEIHNQDGRHISYLNRSPFQSLDCELFLALRKIVEMGNRSVAAIAASGMLPPGTIFCDGLICSLSMARSKPVDRIRFRSEWWNSCYGLTGGRELIFFDPDNGIETFSVPKHHPKAGKYIFWDELMPFWDRGHALLVYHHLNRTKSAREQVEEMTKRMRTNFRGAVVNPLVFRRGSCRVFWLVYRRTALGRELGRRANKFLRSGWAEHFRAT